PVVARLAMGGPRHQRRGALAWRTRLPQIEQHRMTRGSPPQPEIRQDAVGLAHSLRKGEEVVVRAKPERSLVARLGVPTREDEEMIPARVGVDEYLLGTS